MPIPSSTGAEARRESRRRAAADRTRRRAKKPVPYIPPPSRSDAAQRPGKAPAPRRTEGGTYSTPGKTRTAPTKSTPRSRARSQEQGYRSQGKAVEKRANAQKRRARRIEKAVRRSEVFDRNALAGRRRAQKKALQSLADWRQSDPEGYERAGDPDEVLGSKKLGFLEREAEGRGILAKAATNVRRNLDGGRMPGGVKMSGGAPTKLVTEAVDIAANTPSGVYMTAAAAKEAAGGDSKRAAKLWKDYKETSAIAAAASGNFKEAGKRAQERPLTTALELSGAKALVGRTGGALARRAPVPGPKGFRKKVRQAGSTARPNLRLDADQRPGEGPELGRRYSKDIINKAGQVYLERRTRKGSRVRKDGTQRRPGQDPHVDRGSVLVPGLSRRVGGGVAGGMQPTRSRLIRQVDTDVFAYERSRRARREKAIESVSSIAPVRRSTRYPAARRRGAVKPKQGTGVQLAAEATVRTGRTTKQIRQDLRKRKLDLARESKGLTDPARIRLNKAERKSIRELEALSDKDLARVTAAAGEFKRTQADVQKRGQKVGAWNALGQSKRFYPFLQTHVTRPAGSERRALTRAEQATVAKVVQRRARRNKTLPPKAAEFVAKNADRRKSGDSPAPVERTLVGQERAFFGTLTKNEQHVLRKMENREAKLTPKQMETFQGIQRKRLDQSLEVRKYAMRPAERRGANPLGAPVGNRYPGQVVGEAVARVMSGNIPEVPKRNRPGQPKGVTRGQLMEYAAALPKRSVRVPARRLDAEELPVAARVLERRARRGRPNPADPAFITQRPVQLGRSGADVGAYRSSFPATKEPRGERSGVAYREGSREIGSDALTRQAIMAEAQVTAMEGFTLNARKYGHDAAADGGRYAKTKAEAIETANARTMDPETGELLPGKTPLVPVNIDGARVFGDRLAAKQQQAHSALTGRVAESEAERVAMMDAWDAALQEGPGRWVLMPDDVVQRFLAHQGVEAHGVLHGATNHFKDVVLTSSSPARWLGGNITDIGTRMIMEGITPLDVARGMKISARAKQKGLQGEQAVASTTGGGLYHASEALNRTYRPSAVGENPARTILAAPWRAWKGAVYALEHAIEELPQYGGQGKLMRTESSTGFTLPRPDVAQKLVDNGGITVNLRGKEPTSGFALAPHPERERLVPVKDFDQADLNNYISQNLDLLKQPGYHVGGWVDGGNVYLDVSRVFKNKEAAHRAAIESKQLAYFDLKNFDSIKTGLTEETRGVDPLPLRGTRPTPLQKVADVKQRSDIKTLMRMHDQQIDAFANRMATDHALEAQIQKLTEDIIGRWGKISPSMRKALVIAPFAQWLGAATRYVFVTLPVHHPIKTGLIAAISEMTEDERKRLGLSYFLPRDKQVYDYQMGLLPRNVTKNKYGDLETTGIRTERMTSFGTAAGLPGNIGQFLLPQFAGPLNAWAGQAFTGEQMVYPDWWPDESVRRLPMPRDELVKVGLGALIEGTVPFAGAARRSILEEGRPAEPYSTILTPATRKKFDADDKVWRESEGNMVGGILEWLTPFAPPSRAYTYGVGKSIEEQGITGETLERWAREQKKRTKKRQRVGIPLGPGGKELLPTNQGSGIIDLSGGDGNAQSPAQRRSTAPGSNLIPLD
jgi:hypothetical protein